MKNVSIFISIIILSILTEQGKAQTTNVPNGTTSPSGTPTTVYPYTGFGTGPASFNYIQKWIPTSPVTDSSTTNFSFRSFAQIPVFTTYINGWGEKVMTIVHGDHLVAKDLVLPEDNRAALSTISFQPYAISRNSGFQTDPYNDEMNYYNSLYPNEGKTAYSKTNVPTDRSLLYEQHYASGSSFVGQGRGDSTIIRFNVPNDIVKYSVNELDSLTGFGTYYDSATLVEKTVSGQHNEITKTYTDRDGHMVCKKVYTTNGASADWMTTNYVYNGEGRLEFILPPLVSKANPTAANFSNYLGLCYRYYYNKYGRVIQKLIPGKGPEYIVYDTLSKPVLVQTPLMRSEGKWQFTIYDSRKRPIIQGLITDANDRATWQSWVDGSSTPSGGIVSGSLLDYLVNGFNGTYPSSITDCQFQRINYYDTYPSFAGTFNNSWSSDYLTSSDDVTPQPYYFMHGMRTASEVYIMDGSGTYTNPIKNVYFYDIKGYLIQTQTLNPWNTSDWDVVTNQYNFNGKKIAEIIHHNAWSGCDKPSTDLTTYYNYHDYYGRLKSIQQKPDGRAARNIAGFTYNSLGQLTEKVIGGVEWQDYKYNIRGQLESINADYTDDPTIADKTFGCKLSYDYGFSRPRYDGRISGMQWRGAGSTAPLHAYGYQYDDAGRLAEADFNRYDAGTGWNHTSEDYTMSGVTFDDNGNILTMNQMGTPVGSSSPVQIDQLSYTYKSNSNQLGKVADGITTDYGTGDFQDKAVTIDYTYDADGNEVSDSNKHISLETYNELDEPLTITTNKGTITNIYDANGQLVQKTVVDNSSGTAHTDVYKYWGAFTYRNDSLLYVLNDEGRARWLPDSNKFKYDFFVKDHLGNVRTVVTSDVTSGVSYFAGHEIASASVEDALFAYEDSVRDTKPASTNPNDITAARLNGSDASRRIGTAILIPVMAGDKFDISAYSYWDSSVGDNSTYADGNTMLNAIINSLSNGTGGFGNEAGSSNYINGLFSTSNYLGVYQGIIDSMTDFTAPRAFVNFIVYDGQMNIIPGQSGVIQVSSTPGSWQAIGTPSPINIGQNGYLAVYLSNAQTRDVYMDELNIVHYQGRLIQEQHYYPYGLTMNTDLRAGNMPTDYKYQDNQEHNEIGLNLSDFNFRQYDYQLGRFTGVDLLADAIGQERYAPYHGFADDPANFVDPLGLGVGDINPLPEVVITAKRPWWMSHMGADPVAASEQRFFFWRYGDNTAPSPGGSGGGGGYAPQNVNGGYKKDNNDDKSTWSSFKDMLRKWDDYLDGNSSYHQKAGYIETEKGGYAAPGRLSSLAPTAQHVLGTIDLTYFMIMVGGKGGAGGFAGLAGSQGITAYAHFVENGANALDMAHGVVDKYDPNHARIITYKTDGGTGYKWANPNYSPAENDSMDQYVKHIQDSMTNSWRR